MYNLVTIFNFIFFFSIVALGIGNGIFSNSYKNYFNDFLINIDTGTIDI